MIKRVFAILTLTLLFLFSTPVYSLDTSSKSLEKYTKKISTKFTRTYCNTTKFGISYEGALAFAIGETNKEFKNNKLNKLIDYSLLKNSIINDLENNCQVYDFDISNLENLKFN
ncbi:RNA-binding protein [Prochlorococcus marinus str. XMU1401]|uniref:RNA-binding protein n=1 Tax=Prochlorococcus marinus str. XMU1401 TaxID=2052594 RepID=A0A8I1X0I7_PROMR|nr:RNA-binding protein [Prochlorococcus marinus]MBO8222727.1 RNA-binding protein [Prochlorococcus marinus str. XMU1401]MBW3061088.1 RNA-binding protein [Prochlorococcus marinus str. XMU1401E]MCQ9197643.1 RNA-binding protein [Prochlorococcus marinus XMU1429]PJC83924.1 RNA-binding protein [Prochlorococcus marinus str. XMU1401]